MSFPRTTHQWLNPIYDVLNGVGLRPLQLGSATGAIGFYGVSGIARPTGLGVTGSALGGVTGTTFFDVRTNGGTGTNYYTFTDVVNILKRQGLLTA